MSAYLRSKNLNNVNAIRIEAVDSDSFSSTILSSNGDFLLPSGNVNTGSGSLRYNPFTDRVEVRSNAGLRALATEKYVNDAITALIDGAPNTLDTLNELAAALNDDSNFANNVLTSLNNRLRIDTNQNLTTQQRLQGRNNLGLAAVAASGNYNDLTNKPSTIIYNQSLNTTNDVTFNSVTAKSIDVESLEFTGTGPIVISSGNDLSFNAAGDIKFNGIKLSDIQVDGGVF
jgi:hypothetical protein